VLVGETAKGRKGQSFSTLRHVFEQVDPGWVNDCITGGLSSGEGLLYQVSAPISVNLSPCERALFALVPRR
jgi:hypothetical protein